MVTYGQVVIGPPGSGKSTYCSLMQKILVGLGRKVAIINLDPANEELVYTCDINICEQITVKKIMKDLSLGPNGAIIHCLEYLEKNFIWIEERLEKFKDCQVIFDLPGQIELYLHNSAVRNILKKLTKLKFQLCVVYLVDSCQCATPNGYASAMFSCLAGMMQLEMPQVNVLTKLDLSVGHKILDMPISYYEEGDALKELLKHNTKDLFNNDDDDDDYEESKHSRLIRALSDFVLEYSLVGFYGISIESPVRLRRLLQNIDRANGFRYTEGYDDKNNIEINSDSIDIEETFDIKSTLLEDYDETILKSNLVKDDDGIPENTILHEMKELQRKAIAEEEF